MAEIPQAEDRDELFMQRLTFASRHKTLTRLHRKLAFEFLKWGLEHGVNTHRGFVEAIRRIRELRAYQLGESLGAASGPALQCSAEPQLEPVDCYHATETVDTWEVETLDAQAKCVQAMERLKARGLLGAALVPRRKSKGPAGMRRRFMTRHPHIHPNLLAKEAGVCWETADRYLRQNLGA